LSSMARHATENIMPCKPLARRRVERPRNISPVMPSFETT
jgi:hypothetical protein